MTVNELIDSCIIPEDTLICVEDVSGECFYCGPRCDYKHERDYKVRNIFPESYGKYHHRHGITILIDY